MEERKLLIELKRRYTYEDFVIGGTSAGAMAFSTPMIFSGNKEKQQMAGEIRETTGLEFLKDVCMYVSTLILSIGEGS